MMLSQNGCKIHNTSRSRKHERSRKTLFEKILTYIIISSKANKSKLKLQPSEKLSNQFIRRFIYNRLSKVLFPAGLTNNDH